MMNTSAFNPNSVHQEHNVVTVTHAPHAHHQQPHAQGMANAGAPLGYHLHPQAAALQMQQSPLAPAMPSAGSDSVGTAHSTTTLFDPHQLEKAYYSAASTATTAPAAASGRFYTAATSTGANSVAAAATQQHHHQHANTILITNNFATQQQFATGPSPAQSTLQQRSPPTIASGAHFGSNGSNIRIVTTLPSTAALQQNGTTQQQVYSISKDVQQQHNDLLQLQQQQQQHLYQQQQQQQQQHFATHSTHLPTVLPQHFAAQHFAAAQPQTSQQQATAAMQLQLPPTPQQYYMPLTTADTSTHINTAGATVVDKMLPTLPTLASVGDGGRNVAMASATAVTSAPAVATAPTSSTVVLDRINICINNHYTDSMASSSSSSAASSTIDINPTTLATSAHAQQPSPIIPAIHHKALLDTGGSAGGLHIDAYASNDSTLVIDEPDSTTTTPHTPPTTPENSTPPPTSVTQQPATTTTTTTQTSPSTNKEATTTTTTTAGERHAFAAISQCIELEDDDDEMMIEFEGEDECPAEQLQESVKPQQDKAVAVAVPAQQVTGLSAASAVSEPQSTTQAPTTPPPVVTPASTLLTPSTPSPPATPPAPVTPVLSFAMGEDVFMRRDDGRFYLGTVINSAHHEQHDQQQQQLQYLVRFDDKSELWCGIDEMRKLGGGAGSDSGGGNSSSATGRMCVACKRAQQQVVVEICERCGRGYHRNCTSETLPGSGIWWCKRCNKPMKVLPNGKRASVCRQLPYHVDALKWDEKHRVNEEQIYCYCGKTGQFDNHMLQCCKCQNWFHTQCMQNFNDTLLRGDGFFVFCCTICVDGAEFLRRLQMSWVDLLHLALYNLSVMKKHHKFHHLVKDIVPFVLEKRHTLPVPKAWVAMSQSELMKNITNVLRDNADRFLCGRECKRDPYFFALRNNGPPILPKMQVRTGVVLTDELLTQTLKLKLFPADKATNDRRPAQLQPPISHPTANPIEMGAFKSKGIGGNMSAPLNTADIYEFRIEDDEKFTSDDEIPIKHIIEKVRKSKGTPPAEKHSGSSNGGATNSKAKKYNTPVAYEKLELNDENANDANCNLSLSLCVGSATAKRSPTKAHSEHSSKQPTPKKESGSGPAKSSINKQAEQLPALPSANATAISGVAVAATEKNSRKRKAFTLSKSYKEIAAEAAAKRYDSSRICDSSSDENSSSSRGTSLDVIIPPPKNFLGLNNPFRMVTPKKSGPGAQSGVSGQRVLNFGRGGNVIKSSIFNTTTLDFGSKLAALKSAGIFPNLSTSNLAKAAGQPRTVRTIKRRLSAKDITIGPNQEVRRRRTRRPSSNVEVISTTTINPIPSNFFPIHAKDLFTTHVATTTMLTTYKHHQQQQHQQPPPPPAQLTVSSTSSSASSSPPASVTSSIDSQPEVLSSKPSHGRRLRQRPPKCSPANSRRSSISSASTSSNSSSNVALATLQQATNSSNNNNGATNGTDAAIHIMQDLQQSVKEYFGAVNRIESGEQFSIRAKRQLANGQTQYLVEWGDATVPMTTNVTAAATATAAVGDIAQALP